LTGQDIGCFYLLFITFYLMGRAGIILKKDWNHEPFRKEQREKTLTACHQLSLQWNYVIIWYSNSLRNWK
jgi:hypothetical protein